MRGDKLYRAIGDADEKYIKSAQKVFDGGEKREMRRNAGRIIKKVLSVAAAVAIIGGLWLFLFIASQKRQDPVMPANTGELTGTADESDTEADTASALSPSDTEPVNVDPESECGKMIQSFDEYLKAKERGKYGDYYVSYCVKINGAYIGFIDDGETDYTEALENEVIDGLPFCYGNGQKLTVINGGEYRYGLAEAFNDGLLNSDKLDQFFVRYSSDHKLYKWFESEYLRQSCEEFLDGEDERNVIDKPEKDKELTLYNYIHIAFCKKLGGYKYAVLYQLTHQPIEETDGNEFYMVYINEYNYSFYVNNGLMLKVLDEIGNISSLDDSDISGDEFKALYDSYTAFWESCYEEYLTNNNNGRVPWNVPELREKFETFITTGEAYNVDYAYKTKDGIYIGIFSRGDLVQWEETVAGYTFEHSNGNKYLVIKDDTLTEGLKEAYDSGVISAETVKEFYINLSKFYEEQNDNQNHSGYETTVKLIRHYWDGYGVSSKTVSTCDLAYSIIDAIDTLNKTGETVNKISDDTMDESNGYFPEGIRPGTLWLEVGSKIYRLSPDLSEIALVETHFGKGYVLNMTDELRSLLNIAWYYYPRNTYVGTYDNESEKLDISHTYTADSTIEIKIKDLYVEKKIDAKNNSVTFEVTSSIDQTVEVYISSYQSDDNRGSDDAKTISLKANETKELTFEFYGWDSYPYMLDIAADNTRVTLTLTP